MARIENELKSEIGQFLNKVAEIENIKSYETEVDTSVLRGEGLFGDLIFGSVKDKINNKVIQIAVKKMYSSETFNKRVDSSSYYQIENYFYKEVFPMLDKFQRLQTTQEVFSSIPRYYFGTNDAVVMEDLRDKGFKLFDRSRPLDETHIKLIFQEYAKFHALSLSLKDQKPEVYSQLCTKISLNLVLNMEDLKYGINTYGAMIYNNFNSYNDSKFSEKIKCYSTNAFEPYTEAYLYNGDYSTIIHGNSRLNNLMFKYNDSGELESINIFDFQTVRIGSPVHDLAYIFYDGGCKELFSKVEELLEIYYETFSKFATQLGSNPAKIYPKTALKEEWKKCAKCGLFTGLIHARLQSIDKTKLVNALLSAETTTEKRYESISKSTIPLEKDKKFLMKVRDLIDHAKEYDIL